MKNWNIGMTHKDLAQAPRPVTLLVSHVWHAEGPRLSLTSVYLSVPEGNKKRDEAGRATPCSPSACAASQPQSSPWTSSKQLSSSHFKPNTWPSSPTLGRRALHSCNSNSAQSSGPWQPSHSSSQPFPAAARSNSSEEQPLPAAEAISVTKSLYSPAIRLVRPFEIHSNDGSRLPPPWAILQRHKEH